MADACERGVSDACSFHARILYIEAGSDSTAATTAARVFQSACEAEPANAVACHGLGDIYEQGVGRQASVDSAFYYFERGCKHGNPSGCTRAASLLRNLPGLSAQELDSLEIKLTRRACDDGSMNGCILLGYFRGRQADADEKSALLEQQRSYPLFESACAAGMPVGCSNLGWRYELQSTNGDSEAGTRAVHYYRLGCEGVSPSDQRADSRAHVRFAHGYACMALGNLFRWGKFLQQNQDSARFYTDRACSDLFYSDACVNLGRFYGDSTSSRNLRLLAVGCLEGNASSCNSAGVSLQAIHHDTAGAEKQYYRGCDLGDSYACSNLGLLNFGRRTVEGRRAAYKYNRRSCDLGGPYGCRNLGSLLRDDGYNEAAGQYFERSCRVGVDAKVGTGCWEAMKWHAALKHDEESARFHAQACRADAYYCKRKT